MGPIDPANAPSLAIAYGAGSVEVGQQIDVVDGLELILEKQISA